MRYVTLGLIVVALGCNDRAAKKVDEKAPAEMKDGKPAGKKPVEWNFQDIQNHLTAKGWETFIYPREGKTVFTETTGSQKYLFMAQEYESADAAAKEAASLRDVHRQDAFAWNRFVFEERASASLAKLKKLLP